MCVNVVPSVWCSVCDAPNIPIPVVHTVVLQDAPVKLLLAPHGPVLLCLKCAWVIANRKEALPFCSQVFVPSLSLTALVSLPRGCT